MEGLKLKSKGQVVLIKLERRFQQKERHDRTFKRLRGRKEREGFIRLIWGKSIFLLSSLMGKGGGCYILKSRGKLIRGDP